MTTERARVKAVLRNQLKSATAQTIHSQMKNIEYNVVADILDDFVALELVIKTIHNGRAYYRIKPLEKINNKKKEQCIQCKKRPPKCDDEYCDKCMNEISARIQESKYEKYS